MRRMMTAALLALGQIFLVAPAVGQGFGSVAEAAGAVADDPGAAAGEAIVFLVRHGEAEADGTRDPGLSEAGWERAARLAAVLADAGLDAVYSTDYGRTRGTAGVVANRLELEVTIYNPTRLSTVARALRERGGRILVVGHSNTTPELVAELGGDAGPPIHEDEHDRLYVLFLVGAVTTVALRY